jgi:hypothetical protein
MYGLINADNPKAASEKFIAENAFTEMDDVRECRLLCNQNNEFLALLLVFLLRMLMEK